jgi:hypothetical protein
LGVYIGDEPIVGTRRRRGEDGQKRGRELAEGIGRLGGLEVDKQGEKADSERGGG